MPKVAHLVSRNAALIESVKEIIQPLHNLQLEARPNWLDVFSQFQRKETAVHLLHISPQDNAQEMVQVVRKVASSDHFAITLVLCDHYQDNHAVALMRAGATDCIEVKTELYKLRNSLAMENHRVGLRSQTSGRSEAHGVPAANPFNYILSPDMIEMMDQVRRVAPQATTLFLSGETGTGKTQLAKLVHELSPRRNEPFLVVDCGALSADLMESELFGHKKGAFTGATCDRIGKFGAVGRGTLVLDEVNSLAPHLQSKLLRAVDDRVFEPVGCNKSCKLEARIIAAANIPLEQAVRAGQFRQDLFYRLNVVGFYLAPLRERHGLIGPLANKLLADFSLQNDLVMTGFSKDAMQVLQGHNWPGNIRELRNTIERAVVLAAGPEIQKSDLAGLTQMWEPSVLENADEPVLAPPLAQSREEAEILWITAALRKHRNNRLRAAEELGISRMSLYNKMHRYGLFSRKVEKTDLRVIA